MNVLGPRDPRGINPTVSVFEGKNRAHPATPATLLKHGATRGRCRVDPEASAGCGCFFAGWISCDSIMSDIWFGFPL